MEIRSYRSEVKVIMVKVAIARELKVNLHFTLLKSSGYEVCTVASLAAFIELPCNNIARHKQ